MNVEAATARKILAIKLADFGDVLLTTPALRAVRAAYPDARLDVLTTQTGRAALRLPYINEALLFDKYGFDRLRALADPAKLLRLAGFGTDLRRRGYDTVIIFHHLTTRAGSLKFRALAAATGAATIVGLDNGRGNFLSVRVPDRGFGAMPERDYWLRLVETLTAHAATASRPDFPISDADRAWAAEIVAGLGLRTGQPLVLVHGGAGWYRPARKWPSSSYAELVRLLVEQAGARVVLLGGKDEVALAKEIRGMKHTESAKPAIGAETQRPDREETINMAGRTTLGQMAALCERAALYIGNDSGATHLAAVVGVRTLAIFGPTNAAAWSPYGYDPNLPEEGRTRVITAQVALPCRPCMYRGHDLGLPNGCAARPCLTQLTPHEVLAEAQRILALDSLPIIGAQ